MKKRLGAIILVVAMLLSVLVIPAGAASVEDFTDVKAGMWYYDYVKYVVENGYFNGTSVEKPTFSPNETMTRAMFVTVLSRIEKKNTEGFAVDDSAVLDFTDAESIPAWAVGAVKWAVDNKIVEGYEDGTFRADAAVTRAEMAVMIKRYVDYHEDKTADTEVKEEKILDKFADAASIPEWAADAIEYCRQQGILIGFKEDNTMRPAANSTRAQVAAVAQRVDFKANYWTITYDANAEGVTAPDAQRVKKGESVNLAAALTREGYTFLGWAKDKAATAAEYAAGAEYMPEADVTFYAVWQKSETPPPPPAQYVNYSYDANQPEDKILFGMTEIVDAINAYADKGYDAAAGLVGKAEIKLGGDVIGGSIDDVTIPVLPTIEAPAGGTVEKSKTVTVADGLTMVGYTFVGWQAGDKVYKPGETTDPLGADTTFVAQWTPAEGAVEVAPYEITAAAEARVGDDFVDAVITAAAYAATIVTTDGGKEQAKDLYNRVEETVKDLLKEYGYFDEATELWEYAKESENIRQILNKVYDMAYDWINNPERGPKYWANFRDDNGYYFDKATITINGHDDQQLFADTNSGKGPTNFYTEAGSGKAAAKALSKMIAKDLENQLKAYTAPTDKITLTLGATVDFDVNDNGKYSNPSYNLTATLVLNGNGVVQYMYDETSGHTVVLNVARSDVKDMVKAVVEAFADKADSMLLDKLKTNLSAGFVMPTYKSILANANPTDIDETLRMQGVDIDDMAADYGVKFSKEPYGPVLKVYVLAVISDCMNKKAADEYGMTYDPTNAALFATKPNEGWAKLYEDNMLQSVTNQINMSVISKMLAKERVIATVGDLGSNGVLTNLAKLINKIPNSASIEFNGYTFTKADLDEIKAAMSANNTAGVLKGLSALLKNPALTDLTIYDFITKDATSGGMTAKVSVRGYSRYVTLRILDVEAAG